jgi:NTE family protein
MPSRALVLGAGGFTGGSWEAGLIAGLAAAGLDLTTADAVIGSSAGAVVGACLALGEIPQALYERQLAAAPDEIAGRLGPAALARWTWVLLTSRTSAESRTRMGKLALAARTVPEAARRAAIESRLPGREWPSAPLKVTAVDARSGDLMVFDAAGDASLPDAVAASCATPGIWPPVTVAGRRYIDGGVWSPANAQLAAGYDRVVIVAPYARGNARIPSPGRQARELEAAGARVAVLKPDRAAARAVGGSRSDLSRRAAAARAGLAQAPGAAGRVRAVWESS